MKNKTLIKNNEIAKNVKDCCSINYKFMKSYNWKYGVTIGITTMCFIILSFICFYNNIWDYGNIEICNIGNAILYINGLLWIMSLIAWFVITTVFCAKIIKTCKKYNKTTKKLLNQNIDKEFYIAIETKIEEKINESKKN